MRRAGHYTFLNASLDKITPHPRALRGRQKELRLFYELMLCCTKQCVCADRFALSLETHEILIAGPKRKSYGTDRATSK